MNIKSIASTYCPSFLRPLFDRVENSPIGSRLTRGVFWSMAGSVISRGLMLCATVLVARMLGKTVYGELGMIQSTVGMFGVFAGFGLGLTAIKHVAEFRQSDPERAGRIIGLSGLFAMGTGGLMALGLFIFAPWLAEHTINAPHLSGVLRIGALILFINALNGAQTGALAGFEAFKTIAHVNLFVGLISFPILVAGAYFGGLTGAVWALAINLCFNWLLNHLALRKEARRYSVPFSFRNCGRELPVLWSFALPATLSGIMVGPIQWACNAMLVNQHEGYGEMGIFNAALVFQSFLLFVNGMLSAPLLSMLSNVGSAKNNRLETANILSSWCVGLFPAIVLLCFPEIVDMLFGEQFQSHSLRVTFAIVMFYTCILTYRAGLLRVLQSKGLLWLGLCNNVFWAVVLLPTAYLFVKYGAVGLASSFAIAYAFNSIVFIPVYMKHCKIPRFLLISKETIVIWLAVIGLVATVFWGIPLLYRVITLPLVLCLTAWAMKGIYSHSIQNDHVTGHCQTR